MIPFKVYQSWYEDHWYGDASLNLKHAGKRSLIRLKSVAAAAALLTAIGSGAALAQGLPPGFGSWQSTWPSHIESRQAQAQGTTVAHPERRVSLAGNGRPMPAAGMASREPAGERALN